MTPLHQLRAAGQSVWLDYLRRGLLTSGGLDHYVQHDAVTGVTSNPTIFGRAIAGSTDYDEAIARLAALGARDPREVFYELAIDDIRMAADVLRPVHADTNGVDGFVSFELEPALAHDTAGSIAAAHDIAARIGKPNVMIKVPGTPAGLAALERLTADGINVNVTLLFSVAVYEQVARAYRAGLERRLADEKPLDAVASVASFFVSRIDTAVDPLLPEGSPLRGRTAIANAKLAYQRFSEVFAGERWERLAASGARVQRPLWASTGTKNPAYSDVHYVEALVGPDTVNTMPEHTLAAFRDHGRVRPGAVMENLEAAEANQALVREHGIDLDRVTARLLEEGLAGFGADFDKLLAAIEAKLAADMPPRRRHTLRGPRPLEDRVDQRLEAAERDDLVGRVWRRDHTVWKPSPTEISDRLGWLDLPETMAERVGELRAFAHEVRSDGFTRVVLAGMGGSSLAADLFRRTFGVAPGALELTVLDTTHPAAIAALDRSLDLSRTLFIAASKSGATIETLAHLDFYFSRLHDSRQFVAITDPGTPLEAIARRRGFRKVFLNPPDVGGRYAALSLFGLVPAALIGADLDELIEAGAEMAAACNRCVPCERNPGLWLGLVAGEAARGGWNKLTLATPEDVSPICTFIEQLVAESTGKEGTGIVPVVDEDLAAPDLYGSDRLFVSLREHESLAELESAGAPVAQLGRREPVLLGAEIFRWEFAVAVAGHVLGINPFDQPNVEEAKEATRHILARDDPRKLAREVGHDDPVVALKDVNPGDYIALQAFVEPSDANARRLQRVRLALRDTHRVATTLGFGPRYLHSTGQLHKGGPNRGVFVPIVDDAGGIDFQIPGRRYTFRQLLEAQALGDLMSLRRHGRRVARLPLSRLEELVS
jgi:transaldolase / glucose-6-phosphate isomerase